MAGHSKWANIKHRKARMDARRGTQWSKCARAIIVAAKNGGGDVATNLTLRYAVEEARDANMPKDTIANAIKKGSGELSGESIESLVYEGYGPNGVAVMLDILTDNRNRTASEIRKIFERSGGNLGANGCVSYLFEGKGQLFIPKTVADEDKVMELALENGAEDVLDDGQSWQVLTAPADFITLKHAFETADCPLESAQLAQIPNSTVLCSGNNVRKVLNLLETLEDHEDVQKVHANFDIPDEEMAALEE